MVAIHTYLGLHVLRRRVIFVDLALAQIAALGTTVGFLFGIMPDTPGALVFSIAFTFLGAAVFCITRFRHDQVPQEAVIGLAYAISCAVAVLVVEKTRGAEHLKDILTGNLLWVEWSDVLMAAAVYSVVGVVHWRFRKQFWLISDNPDAAHQAGVAVRAWDFLFYVTFGVVIAFSTRVAGVLLVFVFLVAPAILALVLTHRLWLQLLIGWGMGTLVTVVGLYLSWVMDLPSGPAVIAFYGVALVVAGVVVFWLRAEDRRRAGLTVLAGTTITGVVFLALMGGGRWLGASRLAVSQEARQAAEDVDREQSAASARTSNADSERSTLLTNRLGRCVGREKIDRYLALVDLEERLAHAKQRLAPTPRKGLEFLVIALADDETPLLYREEGVALLKQATGRDFGYRSEAEASENSAAITRICDHIRTLKSPESMAPP
ncbi:MAG: metal ABC transporter permease [Polyangiaceae bacterium]|nr:metal ABC transporter permease [Polyangiaceae bacterium]